MRPSPLLMTRATAVLARAAGAAATLSTPAAELRALPHTPTRRRRFDRNARHRLAFCI